MGLSAKLFPSGRFPKGGALFDFSLLLYYASSLPMDKEGAT